jgi:glycosyltransferase involved in cell wall biosynthesis
LIPVKGHELLIRAVASLAPEFPALRLELIGDGPQLSRLQALAQQLQIRDRVHFSGRQPRQQVAEAMRRCTVFALPSRYSFRHLYFSPDKRGKNAQEDAGEMQTSQRVANQHASNVAIAKNAEGSGSYDEAEERIRAEPQAQG